MATLMIVLFETFHKGISKGLLVTQFSRHFLNHNLIIDATIERFRKFGVLWFWGFCTPARNPGHKNEPSKPPNSSPIVGFEDPQNPKTPNSRNLPLNQS